MRRFEYCCVSHIAGMPCHSAIVSLMGAGDDGRHAIQSVELPGRAGEEKRLPDRLELLRQAGWELVDVSQASVEEVTSSLYMFKRPRG